MLSQRFYPKGFGRVVTAIKHVDAHFLSHRVSPMRSFSGDERVHSLVGGLLQFTTGAACHHTDAFADFRATREGPRRDGRGALETRSEVIARDGCASLETE